jgi:hypothetical protein
MKKKMTGMYMPETGKTYIPDPNDPLITGVYPEIKPEDKTINAATAKQLQAQFLTEEMAWKTKDIINKGNEAINKALRNNEEIKSYFEKLGYKLTRTVDILPALKGGDSSCEMRMPAHENVYSSINISIVDCAAGTSPFSYSKSCATFGAIAGTTA